MFLTVYQLEECALYERGVSESAPLFCMFFRLQNRRECFTISAKSTGIFISSGKYDSVFAESEIDAGREV